jgi:serine/threonine protein phosphatase PrpC
MLAIIGRLKFFCFTRGAVKCAAVYQTPPPALRIEYAEVSLLGNRTDNQDRVTVAVSEHSAFLIVIDGMGGHSDGARAAETAIKVLGESFWHTPQPILDPLGFLHLSLGRAHEEVARLGANLPLEMRPRATCAICLVQNGSAFWAHIGDSRLYLLRRGKVFKRTRDHSHVEFLMREGVITPDQAQSHPMRNFVECCLGGEPFLPEMSLSLREPLEANDILLVCSDGLWGGLDDAEIGGAFPLARAPLRDELQRLAERSVSVVGAGSDNTSVAAVRWIGNA